MERVIVTGALGFIGFHLCNYLLTEGVEVIGIDKITANNRKIMEEKKDLIGRNALFHYLDNNIEKLNFHELTKGVDIVYHLAAATNMEEHRLNNTINNNVTLTEKIAKECRKKARIIYSSTVQVYGNRIGVITEQTPTNPTNSYSLTKLAGEGILKQQFAKRGVSYTIIRLPVVYGSWQREDLAFHQLLLNKLAPQKMEVKDDPCPIDLLHVNDTVFGLYRAGEVAARNETINLSSGKERQWFEAKSIISGEKDEGWTNNNLQVRISNEKVKQLLHFIPSTSLEAGIKEQEEHLKKWLHLYKE